MTLGEKIKEARKQCCLSQEQLAEKMAVSRSAKWETNNGLPDVENLKTLATLLNVSIDYLLDNGDPIDSGIIQEPYNLSDYGRGSKKKKKDRVIREKYPDKTIWCYTGFIWEELIPQMSVDKNLNTIINNIDVLLDGKFVLRLALEKLQYVGSSNQCIIDVKRSLKEDKKILYIDNNKLLEGEE